MRVPRKCHLGCGQEVTPVVFLIRKTENIAMSPQKPCDYFHHVQLWFPQLHQRSKVIYENTETLRKAKNITGPVEWLQYKKWPSKFTLYRKQTSGRSTKWLLKSQRAWRKQNGQWMGDPYLVRELGGIKEHQQDPSRKQRSRDFFMKGITKQ